MDDWQAYGLKVPLLVNLQPDVIRYFDRPLKTDAGFVVPRGNLFDSAIMKTGVISEDFRLRYLSSPGDPDAVERGCGYVGYPGAAEVWIARRQALVQAGGYASPASQTPWQEMQRAVIGQLQDGAVLESAVKFQRLAQIVGTPRHSH